MRTTAPSGTRYGGLGFDGGIHRHCLFPAIGFTDDLRGIARAERGGEFHIAPQSESLRMEQMYLPDTNVLMTRFYAAHGIVKSMYFMPLTEGGQASDFRIVRHLNTTKSAMRVSLRCAPCFDYARIAHRLEIIHSSARFAPEDGGPALQLTVK